MAGLSESIAGLGNDGSYPGRPRNPGQTYKDFVAQYGPAMDQAQMEIALALGYDSMPPLARLGFDPFALRTPPLPPELPGRYVGRGRDTMLVGQSPAGVSPYATSNDAGGIMRDTAMELAMRRAGEAGYGPTDDLSIASQAYQYNTSPHTPDSLLKWIPAGMVRDFMRMQSGQLRDEQNVAKQELERRAAGGLWNPAMQPVR